MDEIGIHDGLDRQTLSVMRIHGHMTRMLGYFQAMLYHAEGRLSWLFVDHGKYASSGVHHGKRG